MIIHPESYNDMISRLYPELVSAKRRVRTVTIQVTEQCNLRCTYCYQINKKPNRMSVQTAKEFLTILLDNKMPYFNIETTAGIIIDFIGGEPLLEIDLITEICDWFVGELIRRDHPWKYFYRFSICSNGVLYFDEKVQKFLDKYKYVSSIAITIDGDKMLHDSCRVFPDGSGSYDIASAAATDWLHRDPTITHTKATLSPYNIQHTASALKHLIGLGYKIVYINCVYEKGWTIEHAKILYRQMQEVTNWLFENKLYDDVYIRLYDNGYYSPHDPKDNDNFCGGTGDMLAVDWRGYLYPCIRYMPSSLGDDVPPIIIGKIVNGDLEITQENINCIECMKCITRESQSTKECFECPIAKGCSWCSAYNYQCGDVNKRQTNICWMHRAAALGSYEFWDRYYKETGSDEIAVCHLQQEYIDILRS